MKARDNIDKQQKELEWTICPRTGHPGVYGRDYVHRAGWRIEHCGHPTALWPYLLLDPDGGIVLMGAAGPMRNPVYGTAWRTIRQAMDYVAATGLTRREFLKICRWSTPGNVA